MPRPEQTLMLTGQVGYNSELRPDWRLPADRLAAAINVWMGGPSGICERRYGCTPLTLPSIPEELPMTAIRLFWWRSPADPQSFNGVTYYASEMGLMARFADAGTWHFAWMSNQAPEPGDTPDYIPTWIGAYSVPADAQLDYPSGGTLPQQSVTVNNKVIFSGTLGRPIVLAPDPESDASILRMIGLAAPEAPTAEDTGSGSYAATTRYYRVRWVHIEDSVVVLRSEPSPSLSFTPSGSASEVTVSQPAGAPAGANYWELEVSLDNATFYLLATRPVSELGWGDDTATGDYSDGNLSEDIGDRAFSPTSASTLVIDGNRVLYAGDILSPARVWYSRPMGTTDIADEECVPSDHYLDLDASDQDQVTTLLGPIGDDVLALKKRSIWRLVKTGDAIAPYEPVKIADVGCDGPAYACEGPLLGGANGEAAYWVNTDGAWMYVDGTVRRISSDVRLGTGTESSSWTAITRVVYYAARQCVLFGDYAYSLLTGGWSLIVSETTSPASQCVFVSRDDANGMLLRLGSSGQPLVFDDFVRTPIYDPSETPDYMTAPGDLPVVGQVQFPAMMPFGHGLRYRVMRCRLWGQSLWDQQARVAVWEVTTLGDVESTATSGKTAIARVVLPLASGVASATPQHLGIGGQDYLSLVLRDEGAQGPWRLNALELSVVQQEPLV